MKAKDRRQTTITLRCRTTDKHAWKAYCAKLGTTMSDGIVQLIKKELEPPVKKASASSNGFYASLLRSE